MSVWASPSIEISPSMGWNPPLPHGWNLSPSGWTFHPTRDREPTQKEHGTRHVDPSLPPKNVGPVHQIGSDIIQRSPSPWWTEWHIVCERTLPSTAIPPLPEMKICPADLVHYGFELCAHGEYTSPPTKVIRPSSYVETTLPVSATLFAKG